MERMKVIDSKLKENKNEINKTSEALEPICKDFKERQNGERDQKKNMRQMIFNIFAMVLGTGIVAALGILITKLAVLLFNVD